MNSLTPQRVAILGPGLLGGSILLALRERFPAVHLSVWARREAALELIRERSLANVASTDLREALDQVDLVILCTPVETMVSLAKQMVHLPLAPNCLITDVGSVKGAIVESLEQIFEKTAYHFVGSHPMAGSEKAGLEAARSDLFINQTCIVTPTQRSHSESVDRALAFWESLGCVMLQLGVEEHDYAVARISHLPRLAASVITQTALKVKPDCVHAIGNGFRDTTRVASGDPNLWTGIVMQNYDEVLSAVKEASLGFQRLVEILESKDETRLQDFLIDAKKLRDLVSPR